MQKDILFEETQAVGNKTMRQFFLVTSFLFVLALLVNLVIQKGQISNLTRVLTAGLLFLSLATIVINVRLVTRIRKDGIYVRYQPFQASFIRFGWNEIEGVYIREYNAVLEYNGWGIKTGIAGRSYTAGGNTGLQLELRNGTRVLIGTRQPEKLQQLITSLMG
ncbi:MAG: DUF6141 family protein [Flavisolibacter sp.]